MTTTRSAGVKTAVSPRPAASTGRRTDGRRTFESLSPGRVLGVRRGRAGSGFGSVARPANPNQMIGGCLPMTSIPATDKSRVSGKITAKAGAFCSEAAIGNFHLVSPEI